MRDSLLLLLLLFDKVTFMLDTLTDEIFLFRICFSRNKTSNSQQYDRGSILWLIYVVSVCLDAFKGNRFPLSHSFTLFK